MALCDSHSGSHWLSLPLSGIPWPSLAHYCSLISRILDRLSAPLLDSQRRCHADALLLTKNALMKRYQQIWAAPPPHLDKILKNSYCFREAFPKCKTRFHSQGKILNVFFYKKKIIFEKTLMARETPSPFIENA